MRALVAAPLLRACSILARQPVALARSLLLLGIGSVLVACRPMAFDDQCRPRWPRPSDVEIAVTWTERLPGWELIVVPEPPGYECPVPETTARARASAGSAIGVFVRPASLRGLKFYLVEKEGAQSWRGFEDTGLFTCAAGGKVRVQLRTLMGADRQPTLVGTYVSKGCRPELKAETVSLRPFDRPPYVRQCTNCSSSRMDGEE